MRDYDENLLLGYVEGDLTDAEHAKVEQWIAGDSRLGGLLRGLIADRQALRDLPHPEAPAWVLDDVDRGLERSMLLQTAAVDHEQVIVRQRHAARRWFIGLSMAATVLLAAGVVIWSITGMDHQPVRFEVARSDTTPAPGTETETETETGRDARRAMSDERIANTQQPTAIRNQKSEIRNSPAPAPGVPGPAVAMDHIDKRRAGESDGVWDDETRNIKLGDVADGDAAKRGGAERGMSLKSAPAPAVAPKQAVRFDERAANNGEQPMLKSAMTGKAEAGADAEDANRSIEIVVQTRDVAGTLAQLNEVAGAIPNAKLIAELPMDKVALSVEELQKRSVAMLQQDAATATQNAPATPVPAAGAAQTPGAAPQVPMNDLAFAAPEAAATPMPAPGQPLAYNYQLIVPADQLQNVLDRLQAAPFNTASQNVAFRRQTQAAQRPLEQRNAAYWPSRSPDYAAILREQVPQNPPPVVVAKPAENESQPAAQSQAMPQGYVVQTQAGTSGASGASGDETTVIVPIVIEFHPVTAAPVMTAPAAPPSAKP